MKRSWEIIKKMGLGAIPILQLRESLFQESKLTQNYLILSLGSCLIATLGLIINSAAVIIGAMIIAPLMLPLRGFSFATLEGDIELLRRSFNAIFIGTFLSIFCSWVVGLIVSIPEFGEEILSRTQPTLIDLLIAIFAGGISGYAKIRPSVGDAIPGTAIAVALMPPICVVGLALAQGEWEIASGAGLLYLTNLIGINLACVIIYFLGGYAKSNELARSLSWGVSLILIMLLAIPLGISFWQLISKAKIHDSIEQILVTRSLVNRRDVKVFNVSINWGKHPPVVLVKVRSVYPIEPDEVKIVETRLKNELEHSFKVIFEVTPTQIIKTSDQDK
ncbi:TIGR00341 family protein [Crocosphaera sp. XPORK-15E]|uniref:TIGR00341 family protein n=1 Tax=Crocosphaera sp. XPORK-15E TaxID=3110247 RepID=UPI002B1FD1CA|nr:TIGR00341 family protein [Crocosphaera sp. XPORK-15E]MEA5533198.1 TIGR00341 family protein [Crocosphaera sp. XPORK-15E]